MKIFRVRHRDHEQPGGHDHRAEQDRTLVTDDPVGDVAAEDRRRVHQRQVRAVGLVGRRLTGCIAVVELRHDVEHQRPADAVEREPFPELGHEQHPQRTRMPHDGSEGRRLAAVGRRLHARTCGLDVGGGSHALGSPLCVFRMIVPRTGRGRIAYGARHDETRRALFYGERPIPHANDSSRGPVRAGFRGAEALWSGMAGRRRGAAGCASGEAFAPELAASHCSYANFIRHAKTG